MDQITQDRIAKLHPKYRQAFFKFISEIEAKFNTTFRVVQGFRTFAEQDALYNQRPKVTNAKGGQSYHNYGTAIDIVEMVNGSPNWNFDYKQLVPIASKYGMNWGGSFGDKPHFEFKTVHWSKLLEKYKAGDFIPNTKYVNL